VSRPYRLIIWLVGILALLGLTYACLPMILAGLVKQTLSARGLSDVQVSVGYPEWRGFRLHKLQFTASAGAQQLTCELTDADIEYHIPDLARGFVTRIRMPVAMVRVRPVPGVTPPFKSIAALPLAALISGQWLSQLPVHELLVEQLSVDARTPADAVYSLQLSGQLRDAQLQVNGDIHLPPPQQKPLAFSLSALHTGEARLVISAAAKAAAPMLALSVNPVSRDGEVIDPNQIELNGILTARLDRLLPMLLPWLTEAQWASGLEGDLNSQWQVLVNNSHWQVTGEAVVHRMGGRWRELVLPRGELTAKFDVDPQRATLQSTLRAAEQAVVLEAKGLHQYASGDGHADFKLRPVVFSDAGFVLSRLLKDWPYPYDINTGRVSGSGRLVWQKAVDLHGTVQLDNVGGHYKQVVFAGLSGEVALERLNSKGAGLRTSKDAQLRVDVVDVGFPVEKVDMRLALVPHTKIRVPLVRIQQFSAQLLGGRARSGPFELDFGREKNAFVVQLEQIGLNEIMKLEQQQGLAGSGMLDGQIPIEITSEGIVVTQGQLTARAPGGSIRYTPTAKVAALAKSNPSVNIVVKALSNFQYHLLDVNTNYQPGGELNLQVRLQGKNPDWQEGQPVHLNLNLEENILALLRSLQMSDDISERVRKLYQTK
jgi:hypothetical protein